jgi:hypothetical protein
MCSCRAGGAVWVTAHVTAPSATRCRRGRPRRQTWLNCVPREVEQSHRRDLALPPLRPNSPTQSSRRATAVVFGLLLGLLPAQSGSGRASADAMIYHAFPEADSYRRIVRDVDQKARKEIERQLPFKVHFDELGAHTLFVAFRGRRPVGLLYLRHEEAEWGLTEIAWALTLDLHVLGFQFQRGRSLHMQQLESSGFQKQLVGVNLAELTERIAGPVSIDSQHVPEGAADLARLVMRSGAKALLVTDTVWRDEIVKLQDLGMGYDAFPTAERFHRQKVQFEIDDDDARQNVSVSIVRATGNGDAMLGAVARTESRIGSSPLVLRWVIDRDLRVLRIVPAQSWPSDQLRIACRELEGQPLTTLATGGGPLRPLASGLGEVMLHRNAPRGAK